MKVEGSWERVGTPHLQPLPTAEAAMGHYSILYIKQKKKRYILGTNPISYQCMALLKKETIIFITAILNSIKKKKIKPVTPV